MKNLFLLMCFIVTNTLLSQNNGNYRLKKLHYKNSSGEKGVSIFYYSEENINYKCKWQLSDSSRYSINYHFFDEQGNFVKKYREFSDSITSVNIYKYNEFNQLIKETFDRSDGVSGTTTYNYDENGKRSSANCKGLNGWFYGEILYRYENEKLETASLQKSGNQFGAIIYSYNKQGNLETETWDFDGKWSQTFTYEYEEVNCENVSSYSYSSPFLKETSNGIVSEENYNWNKEKGGPSFYKYDSNKLTEKTFVRSDGLKTITSYIYDCDGLLMKSFRSYADGRKAEFTYNYNENRQLTRRLCHIADSLAGSETYIYNKEGILESAKWNKFDGWLSGDITFDCSNKNEIEKAHFNNPKFAADIEFNYNSNFNISEINWKFSFGETQTYSFKYK